MRFCCFHWALLLQKTCFMSCGFSKSYRHPLFLLPHFQYFPKFSLNPKSPFTCQVCHSPASRHRVGGVGWVWTQTMSSQNGADVLNKPSAALQGHPIYWENHSEQLPGISFSQTRVKLKKIHRSNLQLQLLEDSRIHCMSLQIMYLVMKSGQC